MEQEKAARESFDLQHQLLRHFGFFGHFMHVHAGGRSGKQHILIKLLSHGGTLSQQELLDLSGIRSASLSEVLAKLESERLITRQRLARDGRRREVALTASGTAKAKELKEQMRLFEAEAFSVLSDQEQHELLDLLDKLEAHWKQIEEQQDGASFATTQERGR